MSDIKIKAQVIESSVHESSSDKTTVTLTVEIGLCLSLLLICISYMTIVQSVANVIVHQKESIDSNQYFIKLIVSDTKRVNSIHFRTCPA